MSETWPANDLERAMVLAAEDRASAAKFHHLLLESDLFVVNAAAARSPDGFRTIEKDEILSIQTVATPDGQPGVAVFTSVGQLTMSVARGTQFIRMNGRDLLAMVKRERVVINRYGPVALSFEPEDIEQLLQGESSLQGQIRLPSKSTPRVGPPTIVLTVSDQRILARSFRAFRAITSARLVSFRVESVDERNAHAIILDGPLSPELFEHARPALKEVSKSHSIPLYLIEARQLAEVGLSTLAEGVRVYTRSWWRAIF